MNFAGIQKLTLLDYPGKVACIVFTKGCNFRCPFCHNASLVEGGEGPPYFRYGGSFLSKRMGVLEGICISGGEPLLQKDIADFMGKVKKLGYSVKLDTNGSNPEVLEATGGYTGAFVMLLVLTFISLILNVFIRRP